MKHYTFSDCVKYAYKHNINFTLMRDIETNQIYSYISDGSDGYITATIAYFKWDYFNHKWCYEIDLNVRYAFKKDYELAYRICNALNSYSETHEHIRFNVLDQIWYGPLTFNNEHYIASASMGDSKW